MKRFLSIFLVSLTIILLTASSVLGSNALDAIIRAEEAAKAQGQKMAIEGEAKRTLRLFEELRHGNPPSEKYLITHGKERGALLKTLLSEKAKLLKAEKRRQQRIKAQKETKKRKNIIIASIVAFFALIGLTVLVIIKWAAIRPKITYQRIVALISAIALVTAIFKLAYAFYEVLRIYVFIAAGRGQSLSVPTLNCQ